MYTSGLNSIFASFIFKDVSPNVVPSFLVTFISYNFVVPSSASTEIIIVFSPSFSSFSPFIVTVAFESSGSAFIDNSVTSFVTSKVYSVTSELKLGIISKFSTTNDFKFALSDFVSSSGLVEVSKLLATYFVCPLYDTLYHTYPFIFSVDVPLHLILFLFLLMLHYYLLTNLHVN